MLWMMLIPLRQTLTFTALATVVSGAAQAQTYDLAAFSSTGGWGVRAGLQEVAWHGYLLSVGVSGTAVDLSMRRSVPLLGIGTVGAKLSAAYAFVPEDQTVGGQLSLEAAGSVGPAALSGALIIWNTAHHNYASPLDDWGATPADLRRQGYALSAQARYRLRRDLILQGNTQLGGGPLGGQSAGLLQAEWRQEALSYRLGAQLSQQQGSGLLLGVSYRLDNQADVVTLSADALLGPKSGFKAQLDAPAALTIGQHAADVSTYVAYEPWHANTYPLRYGVGLSLSTTEQQTWRLRVQGGTGGYGAELGWTWRE